MSQAAVASEGRHHNGWIGTDFLPGLVSIIIPTYNRAHLITNALESIRRQRYRCIEVLVVDDGSDDDTDAVVGRWIEQNAGGDIHGTYVRQPNRGAPAARNEGLRRSRGEYIQFLDSDDVILPGKLESQVAALQGSPSCQYVWSDRERAAVEVVWDVYGALDAARMTAAKQVIERVSGYDKRRLPNQGGQGIYRRSVCVELGPWDEDLLRHQDWEFNVRLIASQAVALYAPGVGYISVNHSGPRVFGDRSDTPTLRQYELLVAACQVAERRLGGVSSVTRAARYKVAILYMSAALAALQLRDRGRFDNAMEGFRRNHMGTSMKLKGILLSSAVSLLGVSVAQGFAETYRHLRRP
jgi:glycosyltransferase involved in cell wall biosynthesis